LALLKISQVIGARDYEGSDGAQPGNDFPCLVEPPHLGIARGQIAVRNRIVGVFLDREQELRQCLIETPAEKMRGTDRADSHSDPSPWAKPYRGFEMLDRDVGLTRKPPQDPAHIPTARVARVERQRIID